MGYRKSRKLSFWKLIIGFVCFLLAFGQMTPVNAHDSSTVRYDPPIFTGYILSDGQFVYGPNVGEFDVRTYLSEKAPHLSKYADDLYGRAEYFSINPKIYLTIMEIQKRLVTNPDVDEFDDPFGLTGMDFISQIDYISGVLNDAYYLHLYTFSPQPPSQRNLPPFTTPSGEIINIAPDTNAGTYAIIAALARIEETQNISRILDNNQPDGFYQTYKNLFMDDDPTSEENHIYIPGEIGALGAPDNLLQLPYLRGNSWKFNGVHDAAGGNFGSAFTNASSIDFSPGWPAWNTDTSNMWAVAAAPGTPTKISNCNFKITHTDGWETVYYHLENIQNYSGSIKQNDPIGVIANTLAEAICNGGSSTGPHLHFTLKRNGAYVALNGTPLSGWYIHSGRNNYDTDKNNMWFEKAGVRKYVGDWLLSEVPGAWYGSAVVTADRDVVAVGQPQIGGQAMTYDGFTSGSTTMYVPMLFKHMWGSYDSALYVQNIDPTNAANVTIKFYDTSGALSCTKIDTVPKLSSHGYWLPSETCLPGSWYGGVVITSDRSIVAVGRPHIGGEITTYNGFTSGSRAVYAPMLFKHQWGYDSALYLQNTDPTHDANVTIKFFDPDGTLNCTKTDTLPGLASHGYWLPDETCLPSPWYGGVVVTSDQNIVAVGRLHLGSSVTTYNGFSGGTTLTYLPTLFKNAGGNDSAMYVQNIDSTTTANITLTFYDMLGGLSCTKTDTIKPGSSNGYWLPSETCLPSSWQGSVKVESDVGVVSVGRPHIGSDVATYGGFSDGNLTAYVPMLFKNMWGTYNSTLYVQNLDPGNSAAATIQFYDGDGNLSCVKTVTIPAMGVLSYWLPSLTCSP